MLGFRFLYEVEVRISSEWEGEGEGKIEIYFKELSHMIMEAGMLECYKAGQPREERML